MPVTRRRSEAPSVAAGNPATPVAKSLRGAARMGKKRALAGLTEATIVDTAQRLIRQVGVDDLSMRMLAKELGVSPMAVYYHVADKDELLSKVRDAVIGQAPLDLPTGASWEAQIRAYATAGVMSLADYPGLLFHGAMRPPTPAEVRLTHHGVSILIAAGFEPTVAARAIMALQCALFGLVATFGQARLGAVTQRMERTVSPRGEAGAAIAERRGFREAADFTIDTILKGLRLSLLEQQGSGKKVRRAR